MWQKIIPTFKIQKSYLATFILDPKVLYFESKIKNWKNVIFAENHTLLIVISGTRLRDWIRSPTIPTWSSCALSQFRPWEWNHQNLPVARPTRGSKWTLCPKRSCYHLILFSHVLHNVFYVYNFSSKCVSVCSASQ